MARLIAPLSAEERTAFIAAARAFLTAGEGGGRVRFRHRGRSLRGVDCVGLVACGLAAVGRFVEDRATYGRDPVRDGLREVCVAHFGDPVPVADMQPGDVVLMRWHEQGGAQLFCHVAIVTEYPLGGLALLHSLASNKEVVEHRLADPWPRRIVEAYRP